MILVRSVDADDLSANDRLRRALLEHFRAPFAAGTPEAADRRQRCESGFEQEMFDVLAERGFRVDTQVRVGNFRIDLVVEGENDRRLAIECDGDQFHGPDRWPEDMARQRVLERAGWEVWRCFASRFVRDRAGVVGELLALLQERGIAPAATAEGWASRHTELRRWRSGAAVAPTVEEAEPEAPGFETQADEELPIEEAAPEPFAASTVPRASSPPVASPQLVASNAELFPDQPRVLRPPRSAGERLTVEQARAALIALRDQVIKPAHPEVEASRGLLRKTMLDELLRVRPADRQEFLALIRKDLREATDGEQFKLYIDPVLVIIDQIAD